ncbi:unnamed protein product [Lactuca virosa]|uniref:Vacuolar protein sorting-associated protein 51 homolog n=1 Tax=Lactuca virosa TaxID=75947 RepID=A0AAU9M2D9_9ASTR|nr:unnamed protein product [Lactuca virosa]
MKKMFVVDTPNTQPDSRLWFVGFFSTDDKQKRKPGPHCHRRVVVMILIPLKCVTPLEQLGKGFIWTDVLLMDEILPEAGLQDFGFEVACVAVSEYVASSFTHLLHEISGFRVVLDQELGLILKLRDMMIGWIHEGFQSFFRQLNDELLLISGQNVNKTGSSLSSSGGGYAFDPAEVRHTFRAAGERFLQLKTVMYFEIHESKLDLCDNVSQLKALLFQLMFKSLLAIPSWCTAAQYTSWQTNDMEDFYDMVACVVVSNYVASSFTHLLHEISGFRVVLDQELGLILKLRHMMIGWIHEGFQSFFRHLNDELLLLSGQNVNVNVNVVQQHQQELQQEMLQGDKVPVGVVLVISQPSVFIEREANSGKIGSSLSSSGGGYAFDPAEVRHTFRAAGERFLQLKTVMYFEIHESKLDLCDNVSQLKALLFQLMVKSLLAIPSPWTAAQYTRWQTNDMEDFYDMALLSCQTTNTAMDISNKSIEPTSYVLLIMDRVNLSVIPSVPRM